MEWLSKYKKINKALTPTSTGAPQQTTFITIEQMGFFQT
jgi:hypothetical protein